MLHLTRIFKARMPCRIPKGFSPPAQGCEQRATLGTQPEGLSNPERVAERPIVIQVGHAEATTLLGLNPWADYTQGSLALLRQKHYGGQATLGWRTQSLWD